MKRFFLDQDNSSHWYLIPVARRARWEQWLELPAEDEDSWEAPAFAVEVGGSLNLLTFSQPEVQ